MRLVQAAACALILALATLCDAAEEDMGRTYKLNDRVSAEIGAPVVVALSRPGEKRWGFHQFPALSSLPDGRIVCTFNKQKDAIAAYGGKAGAYVSADGGATWRPLKAGDLALIAPHPSVSELFDGEYLCVSPTPAFDGAKNKVTLPKPVSSFRTYRVANNLYRLSDFSKPVRDYFAKLPAFRWTPKTKKWTETTVDYDTKGMLLWARAEGPESHLMPQTWFERPLIKVGKELMYADYRAQYLLDDGTAPKHRSSFLMVSTDNGRSFQRRATIATDPTGNDLMGEPRLSLNARGELVCIVRREVSAKRKPMVITYSKDAGRTWTKPRPLFEFGVFPSMTLLDCGVMALSFGRPGVHLSFSPDGGGRTWTDPITLRKGDPKKAQTKTCGYTAILNLDANSFLVTYSDFEYKGEDGKQRKAILVRKIAVHTR